MRSYHEKTTRFTASLCNAMFGVSTSRPHTHISMCSPYVSCSAGGPWATYASDEVDINTSYVHKVINMEAVRQLLWGTF